MDAIVEKFVWVTFGLTWSVSLFVIARNFIILRRERAQMRQDDQD